MDEVKQFLGKTANTFIEKNLSDKFEHLTIDDDLLKLPGFNNQETCHYSAVESDYAEPKNYREMMKQPDDEKEKWLEGVKKE